MLKEKYLAYLEIAVDEQNEGDTTHETEVEQPVGNTDSTETETDVEQPVNEYDIDGEKYTIEQIKEWKQGNLRQSDYTRKTQELANFKNQYNDAIELYNYLKENPEIAKRLAEESPEQAPKVNKLDPSFQRINDLDMKFKALEIDKALENIKMKDKDADELEILQLATDRGMNITDAYNAWRGANFDKILAKRLKEQSSNITEQIKTNAGVTKTLIKGSDGSPVKDFGLSEQQKSMAEKLGMTQEEYKKWL